MLSHIFDFIAPTGVIHATIALEFTADIPFVTAVNQRLHDFRVIDIVHLAGFVNVIELAVDVDQFDA